MTTPSRQISYLPISDLQPDPRNPKSHALDVIDDSIGRFGYVEPIVLDERTGYIVSGHGRTKTLQQMAERGETPPEGLQIDADGNWLAPVVTGWASRSDSEAAAALIALNRTTELGGWVDDALLNILEELTEVDAEHGLEGIGFTDADLEALKHLSYSVIEDGPRDLDDLYETVGEVTDEDLLTTVTLKLPKDVAGDLVELLGDSSDRHLEAARLVMGGMTGGE